MNLRLVVPLDVAEPTGGNIFDRSLARALRDSGDVVDVVPCHPAELETVVQAGRHGPVLVDGLLACHQPEVVEQTAVAVLVHMPLALGAGPHDPVSELDARERRALSAATTVIATSNWSARYLEQRHRLVDVAVAAPGVDRASIVDGSDPPLLVQVAALLPHKNQLGVVAALARVQDLPWRARLVGSPDRDVDYAHAVHDAVASAGLAERIELPGTVDRDAAWAGADLALLPSLAETFGMVVTEALARGIPAIVSEGGSAEALGFTVEGERPGIVVPPGDAEQLATGLRHWLEASVYRAVLREHAIARRDTLEGWEATARNVRAALRGI